MKKLLLASAAMLALFGGTATAADLSVRAPVYRAPPPVVYVPVYPAPVYDYQQPMYYGPTQPSVTLTIPLR